MRGRSEETAPASGGDGDRDDPSAGAFRPDQLAGRTDQDRVIVAAVAAIADSYRQGRWGRSDADRRRTGQEFGDTRADVDMPRFIERDIEDERPQIGRGREKANGDCVIGDGNDSVVVDRIVPARNRLGRHSSPYAALRRSVISELSISASRNASSRLWPAFKRGSQCVW